MTDTKRTLLPPEEQKLRVRILPEGTLILDTTLYRGPEGWLTVVPVPFSDFADISTIEDLLTLMESLDVDWGNESPAGSLDTP